MLFSSLFVNFGIKRVKLTVHEVNTNCNMSTNIISLQQSKADLKDIFYAGVRAVLPKMIVKSKVNIHNNTLQIGNKALPLQDNVYLVGFGKAVMGMAITLEQMLGDRLKKGIVSVPTISKTAIWNFDGASDFPKLTNTVIKYCEGAMNNQPDNRSLETTHDIMDLAERLTEKDTLIVLVSGGGSALLYMPRPVIDAEDKLQLCKSLQNAGADIKELNTVRRKLSLVKGGGLARIAYPASVITLILSDIVGDPVDLIASGPTVYSSKAPEEVVAILKKYNLYESLEGDLKTVVTSKETFNDAPLLNPAKEFKHVNNIILANNSMAIEAAKMEALRKKFIPIILRNDIKGNVHDVSLAYVHVTSLICLLLEKAIKREKFFEEMQKTPILPLSGSKVDEIYDLIENVHDQGVILIGGGEPTVVVKGNGKGGRNQELALYFSLDWLGMMKSNPRFAKYDVIMLSAGTDGQDGPTDAAGAFGYPAIGPIVHDLYTRLKSMALKESAQAVEKIVKTEERNLNLCKQQELSGFIKSQNKALQLQMSEVVSNKESISDSSNTNNIDQDTYPIELTAMEVERMLPENVLKNNDTYNFFSRFKKGADLVKTGFTNTNVMDLHFIYIKQRKCGCEIDFTARHISNEFINEHDLHVDSSTIEKYNAIHAPLAFKKDSFLQKLLVPVQDKMKEHLNITIIDDNLADPCCNKERKFPNTQNT